MAGPTVVDKQSQRTTSSIAQARRKPDFGKKRKKKCAGSHKSARLAALRKKKHKKPTEITIIRLGMGG